MGDMALHPDDVVASKSNELHLAVVERTHGDVDTHEPRPGRTEPESISHDKEIRKPAFSKFMRDGVPPKGSVLVRWHHKEGAYLMPESKLILIDRSLLIGDIVKEGPQDAMSGVVLNTFTTCTLQPICDLYLGGRNHDDARIKGLLPPTGSQLGLRQPAAGTPSPLVNIPASELQYAESPTEEDLVIYKDWIGRVASSETAIALKLKDNGVVEINQEFAEHADGAVDSFNVGDIATTKKGNLRTGRWIFGQYNPNTPPIGTVVETRTTALGVVWLQQRIGSRSANEPPTPLERDELESTDFRVYDRSRRPVNNQSRSKTLSNSEIDIRLGLRVKFKDLIGACEKYDGSTEHGKLSRIDRRDTLGYDLNVFDVVKFHTDVTVQWQDLTVTRESSTKLIPDMSIEDEHAVWPAEITQTVDLTPVPWLSNTKQPGKVGVVQTVSAAERMANVRWAPDAAVHYAVDQDDPSLKGVVSSVVGLATGECEDISLYDVEAPGSINVRRGDIVLIASQGWKLADIVPTSRDVEWLGEIVDTLLDGSLTIRLGAATEARDINLKREEVFVAVRSDGTGGGGEWDDGDDGGPNTMNALDPDGTMFGLNGDDDHIQMFDPNPEPDTDDESNYDSFDTEEEEATARYEDENGDSMDEEDVQDDDWESEDQEEDADVVMADAPEQDPPTANTAAPADAATSAASSAATESADPSPPSYDILSTAAPTSHAYISTAPTANPIHTKRVAKEHRILRSPGSLPAGVYVRTWESRLDLLRILLLGPAETPYADAPFVVDLHLPSGFPAEPPLAYFHSWTAPAGLAIGSGRVNPNLYEDGKICLSLLGTWEGGKGEGWSAARSSVLQVLVSLLGLVLVRQPYYNEAGYEPLVGSEGSRMASRVYSEGVVLRARGFVVAAVERMSGGDDGAGWGGIDALEDVVKWCYRDERGPCLLGKIILDVEAVLERSEEGKEEVDGVTVVSKGACIPLRRVLEKLRAL